VSNIDICPGGAPVPELPPEPEDLMPPRGNPAPPGNPATVRPDDVRLPRPFVQLHSMTVEPHHCVEMRPMGHPVEAVNPSSVPIACDTMVTAVSAKDDRGRDVFLVTAAEC
jgi:hypothetical protein